MKNSKFKDFIEKHKEKIVIIGSGCALVVTTCLLKGMIDDKKYSKIIRKLNEEVIIEKNRRIAAIRACEEKDTFAKRFFSQGTRDGYSECARQLSYMRWTTDN